MKKIINFIVVLALLAVIVFFGNKFLNEREFRADFNVGIDKINAGKHGDASTDLEALYKKYSHDSEKSEEIKSNLIACYRHMSTDPSLELKHKQAILKALYTLDPTALTPAETKILNIKN